jgi:hypothetical protein
MNSRKIKTGQRSIAIYQLIALIACTSGEGNTRFDLMENVLKPQVIKGLAV